MKKRIVSILSIILFICLICNITYAAETSVTLQKDKDKYTSGNIRSALYWICGKGIHGLRGATARDLSPQTLSSTEGFLGPTPEDT